MRKYRIATGGLAGLAIAAIAAMGAPAVAAESSAETESTCSINYETQESFCVDGDIQDLKAQLLEEENTLLVENNAKGHAEVAASQNSAARSGETLRASYVLGVGYDGANYTGRKIVFNTSVSTTCSTHSFSWDNLGFAYYQELGFTNVDNSLSSVAPGPGCKMWLYDGYNRTGSIFKANGNNASLGWADNLASSIWFTG